MLPNLTRNMLAGHANAFLTVDIGDYTYGAPRLLHEEADYAVRRLSIGRYCSIAEHVQIFVGRYGRHNVDGLTTYPLGMVVSPEVMRAVDARFPPVGEHLQPHLARPLDVTIGHDVWIGIGATVMAGVTIGDGAVIGSQAIVTRDVEPYAIVVGSPAREVRKRHAPDIVARLRATQWWWREPDDLYTTLEGLGHSCDIAEVLARLERRD